MKTSGLHAIGLLIFVAVLQAFPASAQLNASGQKYSLAVSDKQFSSLNNYYAQASFSEDMTSAVSPVFIASPLVEDSAESTGEPKPVVSRIAFVPKLVITKTEKAVEEEVINFKTTSFSYPTNSRYDVGLAEFSTDMLIIYAKALKQYAKKNGYDTSYAFLSNMGMLCNRKRFFIVNLSTMQIEESGLVAHGRGQGKTMFDKQYSNEPGSKCTSLGKYKILNRYNGSFGEAFKMDGLDSTNKNAFNRNIVLHSMSCIPDRDKLFPACVSEGCPAVSPKLLVTLKDIIESRKKPVLLWIFDSNLEQPADMEPEVFSEPVSTGYRATVDNCYSIRQAHVDKSLHSANGIPVRKNIVRHVVLTSKQIVRSIKKKISKK